MMPSLATAASPARFQSTLASPLPGVSIQAWTRFAQALEVQPIKAISESGGYGCYDMRPRRLVELGYAGNLQSARTPKGRMVYTCEFIHPWTAQRFLSDPIAQHKALALSMALYHRALSEGRLTRPEGVSLAGVLAILHRGGRGALAGWPTLFEHTAALYEQAEGVF